VVEAQLLHLNIAHFDKCRKCRMFLTTFTSVVSCSQVSQMLFKHTAIMMTLRRQGDFPPTLSRGT
jgi:hypothetical protein